MIGPIACPIPMNRVVRPIKRLVSFVPVTEIANGILKV